MELPDCFGAVPSAATQQQLQMTPDLLRLISEMQPTPPVEFPCRGSWTATEDSLLVSAVHQFGVKRWTDVARMVPSRTSKQCRERWFNGVCPGIKHDPFEPWEDDIIIRQQREIGNRWSIIARQLPGRSTNSIKNRWYSGLKAQHPSTAHLGLDWDPARLLNRDPRLCHQEDRDLDPPSDLYPGTG
jgi:hypothetical protein